MAKLFSTLITFLILAVSCNPKTEKIEIRDKSKSTGETYFYSKIVADTFTISVKLPNQYNSSEKYPVVYILDANIYFDILGTVIKKYNELDLLPPVILVGIGYKDIQSLDSLRNRDDTFPVANAEYEMPVSGGADKFLSFINTELIPYIDLTYTTDTTKRVLMGHSLGGYFTSFALLQNIRGRQNKFNYFIAASPSVHYNKYYLLDQLKAAEQQPAIQNNTKVYITFGQLEDVEDEDDHNLKKVGEVSDELKVLLGKRHLAVKCDIFSNLAHMDTPIPTFIKGLQWVFQEDKK